MLCPIENWIPTPPSWEEYSNSLSAFRQVPHPTYYFKPEDFVWLELSMIAEVERVLVSKDDKTINAVSVVNDNDVELRYRIYDRELAIIDAHPHFNFDFHILPRMGRELNEVLDDSTRAAYTRR